MSKTFHIGDLLSIIPGLLASRDGVGGVYKILGHLTGDTYLMTHQLPQASEVVEPYLLAAFPWLGEVEAPTWPEFRDRAHAEQVVFAWVDEQADRFGAWHEVESLPPNVWGEHNPYDDLVMLVGDKPIITVVIPEARP